MIEAFIGVPSKLPVAAAAVLLACLFCGCASRVARTEFPEASTLPANPAFPDPLVMQDGRRVTSREQWVQERRPELKALFEHYMYGPIPPKPGRMEIQSREYADFLGGRAVLRIVTLNTGPAGAPSIDLMLVLPKGHAGPVPVFLAMNFCGNHALTKDPRVPLAHSWIGSCPGCTNNRATEAARGTQAADWPLEEIVGRGYALAAFFSGDIDSDRADASNGLYAWLSGGDAAKNVPADRGTLAAWAWGFQRCVDYLVTDRDIDAGRVAAVGHSRNGKTALLAAAFDERIAMAFPHQAGSGGSGPSRVAPELAAPQKNGRPTAETIAVINKSFPHWFNGEFKKFNDSPERLPIDQNCLVALCAPRPVLFSSAEGDRWANPTGQFQILQAADPVYRFLGVEGLASKEMPAAQQLVASRLGYFIREGNHAMTAGDWGVFLNFADRQWRPGTH
ncbi:MAG: (4-O-methyl)-D-glucuronate---lignin esterase [Verrucomicrobiota bacterium]|jgi:dienelactone hydrolase